MTFLCHMTMIAEKKVERMKLSLFYRKNRLKCKQSLFFVLYTGNTRLDNEK